MRTEMYRDQSGEWRWRRIAVNGNVVADSGEGYVNKQDCRDMAVQMFGDEPVEVELES